MDARMKATGKQNLVGRSGTSKEVGYWAIKAASQLWVKLGDGIMGHIQRPNHNVREAHDLPLRILK